ncbi:hypothetical protein ABC733_07620 [Mangrovibacter sp. SLW1]
MQMIFKIDNDLIALNQAIKSHYEWAGKLLELALLGGKRMKPFCTPQLTSIVTSAAGSTAISRKTSQLLNWYHVSIMLM